MKGYLPRPWAEAELFERSGNEAITEGITKTVTKALSGENTERLHWSVVRDKEAAKLSADANVDVPKGLVHSIDPNEVRHAMKEHGNPLSEESRGQEAITPEDFVRIPDVVKNYDSVESSVTDQGIPALVYRKKIGNTIFVVEEIRNKRHEAAFKSMWKMADKEKGEKASPPSTPETTVVGPTARDAKPSQSEAPPAVTSETTRDMTPSGDAAPVQENQGTISIETIGIKQADVKEPSPDTLLSRPSNALPARERLGETPAQPVSVSAIIDDLAAALDVPVRIGKMGVAGARRLRHLQGKA